VLQTEATASLLGPSQVARVLGVSRERVVQLANEGRLTAMMTPLGRLFDADDVERLAREREEAAAA
jgi:excisionase family DNA binding protein